MSVKGFNPLAAQHPKADKFPMSVVLDRIEKYLADHPELTAAGWSVAAGLDNSTVRHMLRYRRNPRIDTLKKLAAAVGEPVEYFTAEADSPDLSEIQRLFAQLTPEEQATIRTAIEALAARHRGAAK